MRWAVLAFIAVLAWAPIALRFSRNYEDRRNPISIAIGVHVILSCMVAMLVAACMATTVDKEIVAGVTLGSSIVTAGLYHWTFWWAGRKFGSTRG